MNKETIETELAYIRAMVENVSNQMQELRDAIRESSNQNPMLSVPKPYEHPWDKYKREQLVPGRGSQRDMPPEKEVSIDF